MSKYTTIKYFTDLQDNRYAYNVGDEFPREGLKVTKRRLDELSSSNNRQHTPLISEVIEDDNTSNTVKYTRKRRK